MNKPILLFLLIVPTVLSAQSGDSIRAQFIESSDYPLSVRFYTINKTSKFRLIDYSDTLPEAAYSPNENTNTGIAIFNKSIGIWLGGSLPFNNRDEARKGKTRRLDLQLNMYGKKIINDIYLQAYRGVYLENTSEFDTSWLPVDAYKLRPDISLVNMGANSCYLFNWRRFSARAPYVQSEFQKKSKGSALLGAAFALYSIKGDSALQPSSNSSFSYNAGNFTSLAISPGYTYSLVKKGWYANLGIMFGFGLQIRNYQLVGGGEANDLILISRYQGRFAGGYNGKRFFAGLASVVDVFDVPFREERFRYQLGNLRIFAGYKFRMSKK